MCGIAGYYSRNNYSCREELSFAADRLFHRGPDAGGYYFSKNTGLAHRRLSIIDTSHEADQPFYSGDGHYVVVFNGEIYNYRELAASAGLKPRTSSDTEVLAELFAVSGESFVTGLNGMFAFTVYDIENDKLFLFRDRIGIKPLYYHYDGEKLFFSSELKALLCFTGVKENLNYNFQGITEYLNLGFIPEPDTVYSGIRQVKAGHYLVADKQGIKEVCYWDIDHSIRPSTIRDEKAALFELDHLIQSSVNYRLICDVPFGTFLSGGIDSSLITAVASKISSTRLKTFSIGFSESSHDESVYAARVAAHLGTEHRTFRVTDKEAIELIDQSIELFDQPFADSSSLPTLLVSRLAASEVKMVITGDGGDELFMGYGSYDWAQRMNHPLLYLFRKPISEVLKHGNSRYQRISCLLNHNAGDDLRRHIFSQEQYLFSPDEIKSLMNPDYYSAIKDLVPAYRGIRRLTPQEQQALFDLKLYLKDDLLVKVDRASMAASLECRTPLLDYRIVEWALNVDLSLKKKGNLSKYLLKKLLFTYLPEELFIRPKWGFAVPMSAWLKGPLSGMIDEYLSDSAMQQKGYFNTEYVHRLINNYRSGKSDYLYNRIWALIVMQKMIQ